MKVFVTGGTGVLGVPAIRMLRERGHDVVGTGRQPQRSAGQLRDAGVEVIEGQLFDAELIRRRRWASTRSCIWRPGSHARPRCRSGLPGTRTIGYGQMGRVSSSMPPSLTGSR